jgi:putative hydrolase of the HAD superfamily
MLRTIIFDFGRVISAQKPESLFRTYEKELDLDPNTINTIMFNSEAWHNALVGGKTDEEFWYAIGPKLGLHSPDMIDAFRRRYRADETVNEEVLNLIHRLHGHCRLAVLSNSPPGLSQWLAEWRILDLFEVVFCSGDEGVAKPDPRSFELTLERLGVLPQDAVFIDDTTENVTAARLLGLHGVLFTTAEELANDLVDLLGEIVHK